MWPMKYFPPPSSLIIWKSLCWSLRYILLCSDLWYIYPENSLYFYSSCNDNNVEPVSYVFLTYFVAICFMVYFDICLVYNRVTQSCIHYMWDVYQTEIIKCDSCSTVGKAHSSPQPPQMLSLCLLMPLNDSNIQICIQVSDSLCGACVCSCMQAKLNVCIYAIWWGARDRSPLLRLLHFSSGIQVHLQEENCLRMCPTQLKNH